MLCIAFTSELILQNILLVSNYSFIIFSLQQLFLTACSPSGMISFISEVYGGHSSDSFITRDSGFTDLLEDGDKVMGDKGFPTLEMKGILTIIPPRSKSGQQFSKRQMKETKKIASARIHIERVIQRMKMYRILSCRLDHRLVPYLSKILKVVAFLVNTQPPIIAAMPSEENGSLGAEEEDNETEEEEEELATAKKATAKKAAAKKATAKKAAAKKAAAKKATTKKVVDQREDRNEEKQKMKRKMEVVEVVQNKKIK